MSAALSINLNKIALIRNSRDTEYPSVTDHARKCIAAGADGITVHPRPDQRHIRADDCKALSDLLADHKSIEFNIEGNPFAPKRKSDRPSVSDYPGFMDIIERLRPHQATLVPDGDQQLTSDHGFDLRGDCAELEEIIARCQSLGVRVSLFMDPEREQIDRAAEIGADRIELYTGPYAEAHLMGNYQACLKQFATAAAHADSAGLGVNAGHDLNLHNLSEFSAALPCLLEVSIGHAFTVDAIELGLTECIARYQRCLGK